jgi:hypothetical protein
LSGAHGVAECCFAPLFLFPLVSLALSFAFAILFLLPAPVSLALSGFPRALLAPLPFFLSGVPLSFLLLSLLLRVSTPVGRYSKQAR